MKTKDYSLELSKLTEFGKLATEIRLNYMDAVNKQDLLESENRENGEVIESSAIPKLNRFYSRIKSTRKL